MQIERLLRLLRPLPLALTLLFPGCANTREDPSGGETHFFSCDEDRDCAFLAPRYSCRAGFCRDEPPPSPSCTGTTAAANEVVVLGDSFFAANHLITGFLEEQARDSGAIAPGERYRDASSMIGNALALGSPALSDQYAAAASENAIKVVIMTGGGADVLLGSCDPVTADCELLVNAVSAARDLFQRMADDGVERLVYVFYPDPADADLRAEVSALRPLLAAACEESPVTCHWVDLRESFAGEEATFLDPTGMIPTSVGAAAAAQQIWSVMREQCVAQSP